MNINRNVLKIVAGALLVASLPAGAQLLGGGNLGGAVNGALGGGMGQGIHGFGGAMGGGSIDGPDIAGAAGNARERAQQTGASAKQTGASTKQAGGRTKDAVANTAGAARSQVDGTSGAANVTKQGAASARAPAAQPGGVLFDGSTSTDVEKHALGRDVSATGGASSAGSLDRSGLASSSGGQANASVKKTPPAPAQATPAPATAAQ